MTMYETGERGQIVANGREILLKNKNVAGKE